MVQKIWGKHCGNNIIGNLVVHGLFAVKDLCIKIFLNIPDGGPTQRIEFRNNVYKAVGQIDCVFKGTLEQIQIKGICPVDDYPKDINPFVLEALDGELV